MAHHHGHSHTPTNKRILLISLTIITVFMFIEAISGYLFNSLALLADAGHMVSDSLSLFLALLALYIGAKPVTTTMTYGYKRVEVLMALLNGLTLIGVSLFIIIEAIERLNTPVEISSIPMLIVAILGLIVNIMVARLMLKSDHHNLNLKAAYLHVLADILGSVAAIIAALSVMIFQWIWADAIASAIVSIIILRSGIQVCRSSFRVIMQGVPLTVDLTKITEIFTALPEIYQVEKLHIWGLDEDEIFLTAHLHFESTISIEQQQTILAEIADRLAEQHIHATLQIALPHKECH